MSNCGYWRKRVSTDRVGFILPLICDIEESRYKIPDTHMYVQIEWLYYKDLFKEFLTQNVRVCVRTHARARVRVGEGRGVQERGERGT